MGHEPCLCTYTANSDCSPQITSTSWWGLLWLDHIHSLCSHPCVTTQDRHSPTFCVPSIHSNQSHGAANGGTLNDPFADPLAFSSLLHTQLLCSHCAGTLPFIAAVALHDHPQGQTGSIQSTNPSSDLLAPPWCKCHLGCKQLAHDMLGSHPWPRSLRWHGNRWSCSSS